MIRPCVNSRQGAAHCGMHRRDTGRKPAELRARTRGVPPPAIAIRVTNARIAYAWGMTINWPWTVLAAFGMVLVATGVLHLLPRLGGAGRAVSAALCRAPGLDGVMTYFIVLPPVIGAVGAGWAGVGGAVLGQLAGLLAWMALHELAHGEARRGPRIVKVLNRVLGRWRNHVALWVMLPAVPLFWLVRMAQWAIYPPLTWLVGLPRYNTGDWVNVSRQKYDGLVGHDLIWCLYCDWMTGLWSLGSEMLRNIESLWCPIRFSEGKKCEHCRVDFPDVAQWAPSDGDMSDVTAVLESHYENTSHRGWYGHAARLTVEGRDMEGEQREDRDHTS